MISEACQNWSEWTFDGGGEPARVDDEFGGVNIGVGVEISGEDVDVLARVADFITGDSNVNFAGSSGRNSCGGLILVDIAVSGRL